VLSCLITLYGSKQRKETYSCQGELPTFDGDRRDLLHCVPHCERRSRSVCCGERRQASERTLVVVLVQLPSFNQFLPISEDSNGLSSLGETDLPQASKERAA
jgi:hypothetical protein